MSDGKVITGYRSSGRCVNGMQSGLLNPASV